MNVAVLTRRHLTPSQRAVIAAKGRAEARGILCWAVEGLREYRVLGDLTDPAVVRDATIEYRADEDVLGRFLSGACSFGESLQIHGRKLYTSFKEWTATYGEAVIDEKKFSKTLAERGIRKVRTKTGMVWSGIALSDPTSS